VTSERAHSRMWGVSKEEMEMEEEEEAVILGETFR